MKFLNNKGFAISGILYGALLLFLTILLYVLHVLVIRIENFSDIIDQIDANVEDNGCVTNSNVKGCSEFDYYDSEYNDSNHNYTTKVRGIYTVDVVRDDGSTSECVLYLPRNIALVIDDKIIKYVSAEYISATSKYEIDIDKGIRNEIEGYSCGSVKEFNVKKINSSIYNS